MLYDALIVLAIWLLTLFVLVALSGGAVAGAAVQSVLFLELFAYFVGFWYARGRTVGMVAWRLHVKTVSGEPFRLLHGLKRFIGALLAMPFGIGYLWSFVDPGGRTWPDLLSTTEILYTPR
jgi:uncharacterized RDD family membrane protein YckC